MRPYQGRAGGGPVSLVGMLKCFVSVLINASHSCQKLNKNSLSMSEFEKRGIAMCCKETVQFCNFSVNILRIKLKHLTSSWHSGWL